MKSMYILPTLLLAAFSAAYSQTAEKTLQKSFNLAGKDQVEIELPGDVQTKTWSSETAKIEITVTLANGNNAILNELAKIGRYDLDVSTETEKILVTSAKLAKKIKVKGEYLKEIITYKVFVPENVNVVIKPMGTQTASVEKK